MLDILKEEQKVVIKTDGFLSVESKNYLDRVFGAKKAGGKLKIEIGLQELELKVVEKKKTRNGGEMMVLKFGKPPASFDQLKNKLYYHTIDCYHILQRKGWGRFESEWFKGFTTCLDESQFKHLRKGTKYLCLVMQEEKLIEKDGEVITYEKGNRAGDDVIMIDPQIINIWDVDYDTSDIKIDYLKLYKPLRNE